ncbi:hypothetical protein ACFO1B_09025 [Dactylosporangium siamense]|uniref:Uncharacterized protein n=1 Tax=Dactylosporangium siamense TaxID=685454 RepID=A0A919Q1L8_9ACTN|nr:hypothetical protein [Dactylosporangium siamense]GIG53241.1 hypothetical protein Dsi01nite_112820 [Dactylosporangium siamense]
MKKVIVRAAVGLTAMIAVLGLVPNAAQASATSHQFTYSSPYYEYYDSTGRLTGQVTYSTGNPMAWSWRFSAGVQALAPGAVMTCDAWNLDGSTLTSYHDNHSGIPVGYLWHSTVPWNPIGHNMRLVGSCSFQSPGGLVNAGFTFDYVVSNAGLPIAPAGATREVSVTTTVQITPNP